GQLAGEQVPELVIADHAHESDAQSEPREPPRNVGRRAARMHVEALAFAQSPAAIREQIDQCLAEADGIQAHSSNRAISGMWSDLPQNGLLLSPNLRVPSQSSQRRLPPEKRWSRCMRRFMKPAVGKDCGDPSICPSDLCTPSSPQSSVR